jgi:serine/threonine protein kinase
MKSLIHPYIIRLYEVCRTERKIQIDFVLFRLLKVMESKNLIYLVTEYAANGELLGQSVGSYGNKYCVFFTL